MSKKKISTIHVKHAHKIAREAASRQAQQADALDDAALMQLIDDCFGDDDSVELTGSMSDDMDDLQGSDDALADA